MITVISYIALRYFFGDDWSTTIAANLLGLGYFG